MKTMRDLFFRGFVTLSFTSIACFAQRTPNHPFSDTTREGDVLDLRECRDPSLFNPKGLDPLLVQLRGFALGEGARFQVSRLTLVPCNPLTGAETWSEDLAEVFGVRGAFVASLIVGEQKQTVQISGNHNPHQIKIGQRMFYLYTFSIVAAGERQVIGFRIHTTETPTPDEAKAVSAEVMSYVKCPEAGVAIFVSPRSEDTGPDRRRRTTPVLNQEFNCGRASGCKRLADVGRIE